MPTLYDSDTIYFMKIKNKVLKGILCALIIALIVAAVYVLYVVLQYSRIEDNQQLEIQTSQSTLSSLEAGKTYTALTYNIGFGAYSPSYSFFMDTGVMKDGTKVQGKYGRAFSKEDVLKNTNGVIDQIALLDPNFILMQEVDTDSTRSYGINQVEMAKDNFDDMASDFAVNFHSSYAIVPITDPHGIANAGLLTFSDADIKEAIRKSYPVSNSFPAKYFDLDRCFSVSFIQVDNGKTLSLINSHMSAYDKGGIIRAKQLELLNSYAQEEYEKGNYVIIGGDFNHALGTDVANAFETQQEFPEWVNILDDKDLAECLHIVKASNRFEVATCRTTDIPYEKGVNYSTVIDGFLVTDNVKATAKNIENGYAFSDHQPVIMSFSLN